MPIEVNMLEDVQQAQIEKMAFKPKWFFPRIDGDKLTLKELVDRIGITLHAPETRIRTSLKATLDSPMLKNQRVVSLALSIIGAWESSMN